MKPILKINEAVIQRLITTKSSCTGKLYGTFSKNNLTVIGLSVDIESNSNLVYSFPAEIDFCGAFEVSDAPTINKHKILDQVKEIDVTDNPVLLHCKLSENKNEIIVYVVTNDQIEETKYNVITENEINTQYVYIRLNGNIPINCEAEEDAIADAFSSIRKQVTSGAIGFNFPQSSVCILGNEYENHVICSKKDCVFDEFWDDFTGLSDGGGRKKKIQNNQVEIVHINMLQKVTRDPDVANHAPICILNKKPVKALAIAIHIDSLSMIHRQTKITKLYEILIESVVRYLKLFEIKYLNVIKDDMENCSKPETFHFYPNKCGHFLTQIYLNKKSEKDLICERRILHQSLLLPEDHPIFRRQNAHIFNQNPKTVGPLINPHIGLKSTENGGEIALVKGKYEYYHYCQNKMDDNGWGCAYRSLQTLASWFVLQGYTDKSVPDYPAIQKCLVDIGDKPATFIGSKQWIGSTEVNFVLNTLFGVTSKILYVSSGEEMATKGPELVYHFRNAGTPIMIGGGVLAHTILGVDYNQETGNLMFLILDPHFTGGEELNVIQSKGWCGWKDVHFWNKTAYYNMCLPQVPREI